MLRFQSVTKRYPHEKHCAVEDLDFSLAPKEFAFIVGPSGSGKSTIFQLLTAEIQPTNGLIDCCGYRVERLRDGSLAKYRRQLGVVFQDFRLIPSMTVYENIALARRVSGGFHTKIRRSTEEVMERLRVSDLRKRYPYQLSGGEQQRVAIARALVNRPKLILADEPTGNLDPEASLRIMELFSEINASEVYGNPAMLVITHEHGLVDQMQKRVIRLDHGRIISDQESGTYASEERSVEV